MHQYKTITQTLLVLSILNLVLAAPVVREVRDTPRDAVVVADDVTTMSERPSDSTTEASTSMPAYSLSAANGPAVSDSNTGASLQLVPVHDSITEASTPAHPLPAADGPAPVHDSTTALHHTPVTLDMVTKTPKFYQKPTVQKVAGLTLIVGILATIVIYSALHNTKKDG